MASESSSGGRIGLGGLLFIVFLILKLTHYINWSWWWVTAPLWIVLAMWLFIVLLIGIVVVSTDKR